MSRPISPTPVCPPPSLAELQGRLFALITARGRVSEALRELNLEPAHVTDVIAGDDKLDAVGRLDIYNGMYYFRLLEDVLQADYPAVHAVLGNVAFEHVIADYLTHHPPNAPSLRHASEQLPEYLQARLHAPALPPPLPPWLPTLAALEWARVDVFDEADDVALTLAMLQQLGPELPRLHLRAIQAHRIVPAEHNVTDVWRVVDEGRPPPQPDEAHGLLLIWRQGNVVYHRTAEAVEAPLLAQLAAGLTFESLCDQLGHDHEEAQAAQLAIELLLRWVGDGLLAHT